MDGTVSRPRVVVLADDLIWQTRLTGILEGIGAHVNRPRGGTHEALTDRLADTDGVVVDLTARTYDAIAAIEQASAAGLRVVAVGQHDDAALRKRALAAGAERVYAYRKLFEDGPATFVKWLGADTLGIQERYG